jgi:hypothetical protein
MVRFAHRAAPPGLAKTIKWSGKSKRRLSSDFVLEDPTMKEIITKIDAAYASEIVKKICSEIGPGLPGSSQERDRAGFIKKELESHLGAGNVAIEEFTFAPGAFLGAMVAGSIFTLFAALLNISIRCFTWLSHWVTTIGAMAFSIIPFLIFIFEMLLYYEFTDPIFRKKQSVNVIGTMQKPGTKEIKHLLILSGHHDSAMENTWLSLFGFGYFFTLTTSLIGMIVILTWNIIQFIGVVTGNSNLVQAGTLGWLLLVYPVIPSIIFGLFSTRGKRGGGKVPGAVDNLAASALSVAMCKFLVKNPTYIPDDTEIRFISFGAEEAGLRGSKRYVASHLAELKQLNVQMLNFEMVAYPEITILTSDVNGSVSNSTEMVEKVIVAAVRSRVPYKVKPASLGIATDAGPFSNAGLKALTLLPFKMPQQLVAFYHQKWDGPDNLSIEGMLNVLKLSLEWISCRE